MSQRLPITEFTMPYGKYRGLTLPEIYQHDPQYLKWAAKKWNNTIGNRCKEYLESLKTNKKLHLYFDTKKQIQTELNF